MRATVNFLAHSESEAILTRRSILLAAAMMMLPIAETKARADEYPTRPITLITAYGPGSASDTVTRVYAQKLTAILGQPVVVENRSGAGGSIGVGFASRAAPDGYSLLVATASTQTLNQHIYKSLPYDPAKDFTAISLLTIGPTMIGVAPSLPVKSMAELIEYSKKNPGVLNYGTDGVGTLTHVAGELFKQRTGMIMEHVPFRGSADALNAILTGSIQIVFTGSGAIALAKDGKLNILAVTTPKRFSALPDAPTMEEIGFADLRMPTWFGLFAPAGTAPAIVAKLNKAVKAVASMPDVISKLEPLGQQPQSSNEGELADRVRTESASWGKFIQSNGLKLDN